MQDLSSGPNDHLNYNLVRENFQLPDPDRQLYTMANPATNEAEGSFHLGRLLRRYWLLLGGLVILGVAAGFTSVVLSSPMYQSRLLLELQNPNGALLRTGEGGGSSEASDVDIQTQ